MSESSPSSLSLPFFYDLDPHRLLEEKEAYVPALAGQPSFRAKQLMSWLNRPLAEGVQSISNLPKAITSALEETYSFALPIIKKEQVSSKDGSRKYLLALEDGALVEAVIMFYDYGASLCLSTQVGCRMGCDFCASAPLGLRRQLRGGEILAEYLLLQEYLHEKVGQDIRRIVLMGIGEPLDNLEAVVFFLRRVTEEEPFGLGLSARHITLSTCGLVPGIRRLADEKLPITLSLSLHAPTQDLREKLMPIARSYSLKEVFSALEYYEKQTNRRISLEYALFAGINDAPSQAKALVKLIRSYPIQVHVNLIPGNPVPGKPYQAPDREQIYRFQGILDQAGIPVSVRRTLGQDIEAACGQLRRRALED